MTNGRRQDCVDVEYSLVAGIIWDRNLHIRFPGGCSFDCLARTMKTRPVHSESLRFERGLKGTDPNSEAHFGCVQVCTETCEEPMQVIRGVEEPLEFIS
jgi:hypothetical protein